MAFRRSHTKGYAEVPYRDVEQRAVVSWLSTVSASLSCFLQARARNKHRFHYLYTAFFSPIFRCCFCFPWLLLQPLEVSGICVNSSQPQGVWGLNLWGPMGCRIQYSSSSVCRQGETQLLPLASGRRDRHSPFVPFMYLGPYIHTSHVPLHYGSPPISFSQFEEDGPKLMATLILNIA